MRKMQCSVNNCRNTKKFKFPKERELQKKWLEAIQRPDFQPKVWHGLCMGHFKSEDILTRNVSYGYELERIHLRKGAIPTIFSWTEEIKYNEEVSESKNNDQWNNSSSEEEILGI